MTKKEMLDLNTNYVMKRLQLDYNVSTDFYDEEGRGYFTFGVTKDEVEYMFDMSRKDFNLISHKVRGQVGYDKAIELEDELQLYVNTKAASGMDYILKHYKNDVAFR